METGVKEQVFELLSNPDPNMRRQAAEDLSDNNTFTVIAALAAALRDENTGVRDAAMRSLLAIQGPNVPRVIVEYIADQNIVTRNIAGNILLKCGGESIDPLMPYLQDNDRDVRKFAVDILGQVKATSALKYIIAMLNDPDENVLISAVEALGNIGSPEAVKDLTFVYGKYDFARVIIAEALGKIGDNSATEFLQLQLYWAMKDRQMDPLTVYAVIEALGEIGNRDALTLLQQCFEVFNGKLRNISLYAMTKIADRISVQMEIKPGWKQDIIHALRDDNPEVKQSAVRSLRNFPDADVTRALIEILGATPELDPLIIDQLTSRKNIFEKALDVMPSATENGRAAIIALISRKVQNIIKYYSTDTTLVDGAEILSRVFDVITAEWETAREETRAIIVDTIFRLDGDRAIQFLDEIFKDPDPWLRIHVMELIAEVTDKRAPEFISKYITDEDPTVQEMALSILQNKGLIPEQAVNDMSDIECIPE
jgi:HEAT repeat protein